MNPVHALPAHYQQRLFYRFFAFFVSRFVRAPQWPLKRDDLMGKK